MSKFYAVKVGLVPGVYETWEECKAQVHQVKGAVFRSFPSRDEAEVFVQHAQVSKPTKKASGAFLHDDTNVQWLVEHEFKEPLVVPYTTTACLLVDGTSQSFGGILYHVTETKQGEHVYGQAGDERQWTAFVQYSHCTAMSHLEAKYAALLEGMQLARQLQITRLYIGLNSALIVNQLNGTGQVLSKNLVSFHEQIGKLAQAFTFVFAKHILTPPTIQANGLEILDPELKQFLDDFQMELQTTCQKRKTTTAMESTGVKKLHLEQ